MMLRLISVYKNDRGVQRIERIVNSDRIVYAKIGPMIWDDEAIVDGVDGGKGAPLVITEIKLEDAVPFNAEVSYGALAEVLEARTPTEILASRAGRRHG